MSVKITPVKIWRRKEGMASLIGKKGTIENFTMVRVAPTGFSQYVPFPVVIVKLTNGKKIMGQLTDFEEEDMIVGKKVIAVLRRLMTEGKKDIIPYVIKFRPL
jgi:uncharacterized OB-fold protein